VCSLKMICWKFGSKICKFIEPVMGSSDGHPYNAFEPYGYFYKYTLPVAILGAVY